jgi:sugar-specific transcriptional regulator TrmB
MIVQKDFLNKLKQFGLNSYEVKIWVALLGRGISTAGELSDISNVPRSRSYDVLESLEKKGFIIMKIGKPIKYIAVQPEEVLERVKKRIREEAELGLKAMDSIRQSDILKDLNILHNQGAELIDPSDLSGSLKGRNNTYNEIESMIKSAQKSITIMTSADGLKRKHEAFRSHLEKASKRGVEVRIAAPITKDNEAIAREFSRFVKVRNVDRLNSRFCLADGEHLVFMLSDDSVDPDYDTAVWIKTPFFCKAFEGMFNEVWQGQKSREFPEVKVTKELRHVRVVQ